MANPNARPTSLTNLELQWDDDARINRETLDLLIHDDKDAERAYQLARHMMAICPFVVGDRRTGYRLTYRQNTATHFDYQRQCWIQNGRVSPCGHRTTVPGCYACTHANEPHTCTDIACLEQAHPADISENHEDPTGDDPRVVVLPSCDQVRRSEHALPPVAALPLADPDAFELRPSPRTEPTQCGLFTTDTTDPIF